MRTIFSKGEFLDGSKNKDRYEAKGEGCDRQEDDDKEKVAGQAAGYNIGTF